jgi:hypothetical protein
MPVLTVYSGSGSAHTSCPFSTIPARYGRPSRGRRLPCRSHSHSPPVVSARGTEQGFGGSRGQEVTGSNPVRPTAVFEIVSSGESHHLRLCPLVAGQNPAGWAIAIVVVNTDVRNAASQRFSRRPVSPWKPGQRHAPPEESASIPMLRASSKPTPSGNVAGRSLCPRRGVPLYPAR